MASPNCRIIDINLYNSKNDEVDIELMRKETAQRLIDYLVWRWIHDKENNLNYLLLDNN